MIMALQGLSDAGGAVSQLEEYLWDRCHPEEIVRFNADLLLDYRARRPTAVEAGATKLVFLNDSCGHT